MSDKLLTNFPQPWQEKIREIAACRNRTSEEIVHEALAQYLGEPTSTLPPRLRAVEIEVQQLQTIIQDLQQRLQQAATVITFPPSPQTPLATSDEDDELEDEPDEILYDFLPPEKEL
jgi:hypothetical protein